MLTMDKATFSNALETGLHNALTELSMLSLSCWSLFRISCLDQYSHVPYVFLPSCFNSFLQGNRLGSGGREVLMEQTDEETQCEWRNTLLSLYHYIDLSGNTFFSAKHTNFSSVYSLLFRKYVFSLKSMKINKNPRIFKNRSR